MKRILSLLVLCAVGAAVAAPVRNPFWPIGYEGVREEISANVREKPKPPAPKPVAVAPKKPVVAPPKPPALTAEQKARMEAEAKRQAELAEKKKREITEEHWMAARKAMRFGGRVKLRDDSGVLCTSVMINGNTYVDGDLVSFTHDHRRYTWRVTGLTDAGTLKLTRVKARYLENGDDGTSTDKGGK